MYKKQKLSLAYFDLIQLQKTYSTENSGQFRNYESIKETIYVFTSEAKKWAKTRNVKDSGIIDVKMRAWESHLSGPGLPCDLRNLQWVEGDLYKILPVLRLSQSLPEWDSCKTWRKNCIFCLLWSRQVKKDIWKES